MASGPVRVAVVGCGYWGINLVRNFNQLGALGAVSDSNPTAAEAAAAATGTPAMTWQELLADGSSSAVAIATPAPTHAQLAIEALEAGKHVFVEKPLAVTLADATKVRDTAAATGKILMVGHLLRYHPAFIQLKAMVDNGELGHIQYIYSNRLNFGRFRRVENILWSFSPHDLSMILALVGEEPDGVHAVEAAYLHKTVADVTTTHLSFPGGQAAHVFVSWLHPYKEQKLVVVGDRGMAVFDDGQPWESKLVVYAHEVSWRDGSPQPDRAEARPVALQPREPLSQECQHFLDCLATGATPLTDGDEALRVLRILERAEASMSARRATKPTILDDGPDVFVHETAVVDPDVFIGKGSRIWQFTHLLSGSQIGDDCVLGQNVAVGPAVTIGKGCRIQNNVSVYQGVTLEDHVFVGPSAVFTNVLTPRAEVSRKHEFLPTVVRQGASIGANATVLCGNEIGEYSMIGAGAVVTSDVPAHALVVGVPARQVGWVSHHGERLGPDLLCPATGRQYEETADGRLREKP